jgi:hypothetical protein
MSSKARLGCSVSMTSSACSTVPGGRHMRGAQPPQYVLGVERDDEAVLDQQDDLVLHDCDRP